MKTQAPKKELPKLKRPLPLLKNASKKDPKKELPKKRPLPLLKESSDEEKDIFSSIEEESADIESIDQSKYENVTGYSEDDISDITKSELSEYDSEIELTDDVEIENPQKPSKQFQEEEKQPTYQAPLPPTKKKPIPPPRKDIKIDLKILEYDESEKYVCKSKKMPELKEEKHQLLLKIAKTFQIPHAKDATTDRLCYLLSEAIQKARLMQEVQELARVCVEGIDNLIKEKDTYTEDVRKSIENDINNLASIYKEEAQKLYKDVSVTAKEFEEKVVKKFRKCNADIANVSNKLRKTSADFAKAKKESEAKKNPPKKSKSKERIEKIVDDVSSRVDYVKSKFNKFFN